MMACPRNEEDLALLAGGDLSARGRAAELLDHVASCTGCAGLLEGLQGDQRAMSAAARFTGGAEAVASGLTESVMQALSVEPVAGLGGQFGSMTDPRRVAHAWQRVAGTAAAVLLVGSVVAAGVLSMSQSAPQVGSATPGPVATPMASTAAPSDEVVDRPVWLRRAPGDGVELTWSGDGREGGSGAGSTYRVLASASARDFSSAKPVEVAGNHLVATMALPAGASAGRKVTYFRVQ